MQDQQEQLLSEEVQMPLEREIDSDTQPRKTQSEVRTYPAVGDRTKEEIFDLQIAPSATTEQIANQIVDHGSKGMWVFKASALPSAAQPEDTLEVTPYQHYSNRAVNQH